MTQGLATVESTMEIASAGTTGPRRSVRWLLALPAVAVLLVMFAAPLAGNVVRSAQVSGDSGPSFANYAKLVFDPYYQGVIAETLKLSAITTVLCLVVGYPVAYFMVRRAGRWAMPMLFLLVTPLLTSIIMRTFGWRVLLARRGLVNQLLLDWNLVDAPLRMMEGVAVVYAGLVHVTVPFMVLSIIPVLRGVDMRLEESARVLGAGALRTFFTVTLPLSKEGVITGSVLVFMLTTGSFVTQLLLGNGQVVNLPLLIFQQFSLTQDMGLAAAMGNLLLVVVLACLLVQMRVSEGGRRPA